MKRKLRNCILLWGALNMSVIFATGCSSIDVSSEDEELIVEYAVNSVLNHDRNYIVKLAERETEAEEPTTWLSENTDREETGENTDSNGGNNSGNPGGIVSVNEAFGIDGFTVKGNGYEMVNKYPNDNSGFSMVAISDSDLLVLKFNVTNNSSSKAALNMVDSEYSYRCLVNNKVRLNAQVTALLNGMNTWNGSFEPGETKEMVLVFQISEEVSADINSISIAVVKDGNVKTAAIK